MIRSYDFCPRLLCARNILRRLRINSSQVRGRREDTGFTDSRSPFLCPCFIIFVRESVPVYVYALTRIYIDTYTHMYVYVHIHICNRFQHVTGYSRRHKRARKSRSYELTRSGHSVTNESMYVDAERRSLL